MLQVVVSILSTMRHDGWAVIIQRRQPKAIKALDLADPITKSWLRVLPFALRARGSSIQSQHSLSSNIFKIASPMLEQKSSHRLHASTSESSHAQFLFLGFWDWKPPAKAMSTLLLKFLSEIPSITFFSRFWLPPHKTLHVFSFSHVFLYDERFSQEQ